MTSWNNVHEHLTEICMKEEYKLFLHLLRKAGDGTKCCSKVEGKVCSERSFGLSVSLLVSSGLACLVS